MDKEILQLIRSSAGTLEVIKTHLVSDADREEKVEQIEELFKSLLPHMDEDDLEMAVEDGMADEEDGDTISIVWSFID